ncbi:MAG: hypothetical protein QW273_02945 [Candidatus Pacearchaeota archaeon]
MVNKDFIKQNSEDKIKEFEGKTIDEKFFIIEYPLNECELSYNSGIYTSFLLNYHAVDYYIENLKKEEIKENKYKERYKSRISFFNKIKIYKNKMERKFNTLNK